MKTSFAIINLLALAGILLWPLMFYGSIFLFDAPASLESKPTQFLALAIWTYPIPAILGNIFFWKNWKSGTAQKLKFYTFISLLGYILIILPTFIIDVICNGFFTCGKSTLPLPPNI